MERGATTALVLVVGAACFAAGWWVRGTSHDAPIATDPAPARAHGSAPGAPVLETPGAGPPSAARASESKAPLPSAEPGTTAPAAGGFLPVDVRLPDGSPAETFTLVVESAADSRTIERKRGDGPVPVGGGAFEVHARAGPHGIHRSPVRAVLVPESGTGAPITLVCAAGSALVVHVEGKPDASYGRPAVALMPLAPAADLDPTRLRIDGRSRYVERAGDGFAPVVFAGLTPGRYAVGVKTWWFGPLVESAAVTVTEGLAVQRFVLPALPEADFVLLRVLGPDGKDLANPHFSMRYTGASRSGMLDTAPAVRQVDGRWRVPVRPGDIAEETGARVELEVRARGLGERRLDVSGAGGRSLTLTLEASALLTVEVAGALGVPRGASLRVDLREHYGEDSSGTTAAQSFDADGGHVFAPRQPGPFELRLMLVRGRREWRVAGRRLDLTSGPQRVTLSLPPLHRVNFTGADPGQVLGIRWEVDGETENAWLDPDAEGRAVADGLPEGEYFLQTGDRPQQKFRVDGPTEVRVER